MSRRWWIEGVIAAVAAGLVAGLASAFVTIWVMHPKEVYLLSCYGVTVGVYLSQQAADDKEASFSADDQKHLQVTPMEIDG